MFLRSNKELPKEPAYPASLAVLGYELNGKSQFVKVGTESEFFNYFHSDSERFNELRKEAMHECARQSMYTALAGHGITELYLTGNNGTVVKKVKPDAAHVSILTSEVSELRHKKDVIVLIGEHTQDLGVWAYRILLKEGGTVEGTAAGLAERIHEYGQYQKDDFDEGLNDLLGLTAGLNVSSTGKAHDSTMGVIILNPGQLLYSPKLNKTMTQATWLNRPKMIGLADPTSVHPVGNRVPGHVSPQEHVTIFFDKIMPQLTHKDVRIYLVGIADGADAVIGYLDDQFVAGGSYGLANKLEAAAFMQPGYNPSAIRSEKLATFLATNKARAWTLSALPKGMLIKTSGMMELRAGRASAAMYGTKAKIPQPEMETKENAPFVFIKSEDAGGNDGDGVTSTSSIDHLEADSAMLDGMKDDNDFVDVADEAYAYDKEPALCATFSGGVADYIETIWPEVVPSVLSFFWDCQGLANKREESLALMKQGEDARKLKDRVLDVVEEGANGEDGDEKGADAGYARE